MPVLDLQRLLEALQKEKVKYLLVGGMAAVAHGMNYVTDDLDICYERKRENLSGLVRALAPAHPRLRIPGGELPFIFDEKTLENGLNFTLQTDWGPIDLLGEIQDVGRYETLLPKAVRFEFYGIFVDTISLEDLIRAKQIAGRTKDKLHLLELEAIREIKEKKEIPFP
jgi:predicted nucleotidyltransferase